MKILFEEYNYDSELLSGILNSHFHAPVSNLSRKSKINYVGYYCGNSNDIFNSEPILIFPKVFLNYSEKIKAFGYFDPEEIIDLTNYNSLVKDDSNIISSTLIYEMSVWLYRAIDKYRKNHSGENISEVGNVLSVVAKKDNFVSTELEIVEALREFYINNKELLVFNIKKSNSQKHRIKWAKTIACKKPLFFNDIPYYFDVHSTVNKIDYDEELIRIFFSVLNNLTNKYGFEFKLNLNYQLIVGVEYSRLERKGFNYLKVIKHRYFNDKMLKLHGLLSMYFERISMSKKGSPKEEYLLIRNFNHVFEEMVDGLIGDKLGGEVKKMKMQPDNKHVDHIYKEPGVFQTDPIYFIADSKYYTEKSILDIYSSYKQFTYVRNVLALNLDVINKNPHGLRYKDSITDGYHPTPNFFISAYFDNQLKIMDSGLKKESDHPFIIKSAHWENRLFDRDTLFTISYRISFMFVIQSYVRRMTSTILAFKRNTREYFRMEFINYLDETYSFYLLTSIIDFQFAVDKHFKLLLGVSFCPTEKKEELILALERATCHRNKSIDEIKDELKSDWVINPLKLIDYVK
jgi:hypothetical protein